MDPRITKILKVARNGLAVVAALIAGGIIAMAIATIGSPELLQALRNAQKNKKEA